MRPAASPADAGAAAAETVLRLAVLLQAGVAPAAAWGHLSDTGDPAAARIAAASHDGMPLPDAIAAAGPAPGRPARRSGAAAEGPERVWADVAAAWRVATGVGAPLAETLRAVASALRDAQEAADDVRVALAEPAGTARLMGWLPLVAVGLGAALGFDTFGVLFAQPFGIACLVAGAALILAAQRWNAALVRRARAEGGVPGIGAELLAIALSGGVSIERATAIVSAAGAPADASTDLVLSLSRTAGVPAVELLRASAALSRHRARIEGRLRAARLSSRLLLPLGVCTLPAFLLLGVAPMMLSVMSTMPLSF
ncbi:type II secretion system F family protein [Microbacterium sulfonylureivorans]|uniref:type II secretion system F family protein n=1 Tax=Microbacterium sulfonylureivorans TaxID=2486854 RepID=UPI000FD7DAC7|nr:type II secretion system F family protein [Microbacterium sulfonylureivorans]